MNADDVPALTDLADDCFRADGGLSFLFAPDELRGRFFPDAAGAAVGAFAQDGQLAACAGVHMGGAAQAERAVMVGMVRPDRRRQGLGAYLLRWSMAQGRALVADYPAERRVLQIASESLTDQAARLYEAHGFAHVFEELVMRRDLLAPLPDCRLPAEMTLTAWQPEAAEAFYEAYQGAFRERPGFPGWSAAEWIGRVLENDFMPEWSLLARAGGVPVGFVTGADDATTSPPAGYIIQTGVIPSARRQGVVSALLVESMRRMQAAGAPSAQLTVNINNPGAITAYARLDFAVVGRRARYERPA